MIKLCEKFPQLQYEWDFSKNEFDFYSLSYGSKRKVWWTCDNGHSYQARVDQRTTRSCGCPYCNRNKKIGPLSVTNPELLEFWDYEKNSLNPNEVTAGSHALVWWVCKLGHSWEALIHNRSKSKQKCPYCINKLTSSQNSLANFPDVAVEYHPFKNQKSVNEINSFSYKKVWWLGICGHEWYSSPRIRTRKIRPTGCPVCQSSKGEVRIEKFLELNKIQSEKQKRFATCRDKRPLPFDFFLPNEKVLIEFNGIQHYEKVDFGMGEDKVKDFLKGIKRRDKIKVAWAKENGYKLLVVSYLDLDKLETIISSFLEKEVHYPSQN